VIPVGGAVERRRAIRFSLHARVTYRWKDRSGRNQEGVGRTRDISILGAFVVCSSPPPVGAPVGLEIDLSPLEGDTLKHLRLEAKSKVMRVADSDQDSGFAATSRFELHEIVF
jgi:PilZ domain